MNFWGNPIIPSLTGAFIAGVIVSLITPKQQITPDEALKKLEAERSLIDAGTKYVSKKE